MIRKPEKVAIRSRNIRDEILEVFQSVLSRPEFGCTTRYTSNEGLFIERGDHKYKATVSVGPEFAQLFVFSFDNEQLNPFGDSFFSERFFLRRMGKVRKCALILGKKISHREVYEVMNS